MLDQLERKKVQNLHPDLGTLKRLFHVQSYMGQNMPSSTCTEAQFHPMSNPVSSPSLSLDVDPKSSQFSVLTGFSSVDSTQY